MLNKLILSLSLFLGCISSGIEATITELQTIEQLSSIANNDTFLLFNVTEVLITSPISLGSKAWRQYVKKVAPEVHDVLTLYVSKNILPKAVETITPMIIDQLQTRGVVVSALTGRGRNEWYATPAQGIDDLTENQLLSVNLDMSRSQPPIVYIQIVDGPVEHYRNGVFYCNHMEMGLFLKELLVDSGYRPANVVVVEDKIDSLKSIEAAMESIGIPFTGYLYTSSAGMNRAFSPMIAHVQLQALCSENKLLSDAEAAKLVQEKYQGVNPDKFFLELIDLF